MAINSTSFNNTPQAKDDWYFWTEDQLLFSGLLVGDIVTLDVMANDSGGKAKKLFSIDDADGNSLSPTDLLNVDGLVNGVSAWEETAAGNFIRISNGKIELKLVGSLAALGATSVEALGANDHVHDEFTYAIRLGNGTLSWATVKFDLQGDNDVATISGDDSGMLGEDDVNPVTGTLNVVDPDHDESHTQAVTNAASLGGYGTYSVDANGNWTYVVNNALVQHLNTDESLTDTFIVYSLDGTASATVTITITGQDEGPKFVDGKVTTDFGGNDDFGRGVSVQPDGKILVAGSSFNGTSFDFAIARYNADGSLDASFGTGGKVVTSFGASDEHGFGVFLDADGKILVAGFAGTGGASDFALARYNADGSLDTGFGVGGKITTNILLDDIGQSVVVQPDGKILVSGHSYNGSSFDFSLVRYNADGSLDLTFDGDGKVTTGIAFHDASYSVALQSDGKIVAAGHSLTGIGTNDFAVIRYNSDGSLDTSFSGDGKVTMDFGFTNDVGQSVVVQPDGKIVVAGITVAGSNVDFALMRLNADGSLDTTFDADGRVTTGFAPGSSDSGITVTLQPDGKILVAGSSSNGSTTDFAIVRYNSDGSVDTSFGTGGKVTTDIGTFSDDGFGIAVQSDGDILVSGSTYNGTDWDFALVRYNDDGSLDTTPTPLAPEYLLL